MTAPIVGLMQRAWRNMARASWDTPHIWACWAHAHHASELCGLYLMACSSSRVAEFILPTCRQRTASFSHAASLALFRRRALERQCSWWRMGRSESVIVSAISVQIEERTDSIVVSVRACSSIFRTLTSSSGPLSCLNLARNATETSYQARASFRLDLRTVM